MRQRIMIVSLGAGLATFVPTLSSALLFPASRPACVCGWGGASLWLTAGVGAPSSATPAVTSTCVYLRLQRRGLEGGC